MGKQIEMPVEEKENLILECLSGQLRIWEAARRAGVGKSKKTLSTNQRTLGLFYPCTYTIIIFDFLHTLTRAVVRAIKNNCNFGNSQYAFTTGVFARIFIGRDNGCTSSLSS